MSVLTAGFSVVVDDLRATADTFGRLRDRASAASGAASGSLSASAGMAGDDPVLARWRSRYDPMAAALWGALGAAGTTLDPIAGRLTATGDAYLAGEHAATPNASGAPPALPRVGGSAGVGAPPPSSTGPDGVPDLLAEYYPGGDPDRLRAASAAWNALAEEWVSIGYAGDGAFRSLVTANSGTTFSTMATYWARLFVPCGTDPMFNAVAVGAQLLGTSCSHLADLIDRTRAAVLGAASGAAEKMSPMELPAKLLGRFTWGITELEWLVGTGALAVTDVRTYSADYLSELDTVTDLLRPEMQARLERLAVPPASVEPAGTDLADVSEVLGVGLRGSAWDGLGGDHPTPDAVHVTPDRITHILDGDVTGGGHAPGTGAPDKSEFPPSWSRETIVAAALSVARDPDSAEGPLGKNHRWRCVGVRDGVTIRVITEADGSLVTAVPLSGIGVIRNPK